MSRSKAGSPHSPRGAERFHEERATYTVASAQPDLEAGIAAIRETAKTLKPVPGVYRMLDARGDVLYVGKARALKNRVSNYTQVQGLTNRLLRMVSQTRGMEIVTTNSEAEALLLEAQLVKRFRPPFNVHLRDDKSFPFILLRVEHDFPRIMKHRGARKAKGNYYGPFASAGSVNTTINALQKLFLLRSCTDSFFSRRDRPCLLYQIKRCSAPCVGRIGEADYAALVDQAKDFLSGRSSAVQADLQRQMAEAAEALDFETASILRDRLRAATFIQGSQAIHAQGLGDADVFALAAKGGHVGIQAFFIRGGQNWGHRAFLPTHTKDVEEEQVLADVILQFYEEVPPPPTVLVDRELPESELIEQALSELAGRKVVISVPQRGERRKLMQQAERNASEALDRRLAESGTKGKVLRDLAEFLELDGVPQRIEVYDNSHIQGAKAVGAMVVAGPEGFLKNQYRKFNIRGEDLTPGDDYGMMREVMRRRFSRLVKDEDEGEEVERPDLLLIDGGAGQLAEVQAVLADLGLEDILAVGVAKGPDRDAGKEHFFVPGKPPFMLPLKSPALYYIQRLRDEAHRFANGAHAKRRSMDIKKNPLDEIEGVGPGRKKALLHAFGSAKGVGRASVVDLVKIEGINQALAERIHAFFRKS